MKQLNQHNNLYIDSDIYIVPINYISKIENDNDKECLGLLHLLPALPRGRYREGDWNDSPPPKRNVLIFVHHFGTACKSLFSRVEENPKKNITKNQ